MQFSENYDTVRTMTCKMLRSRSDALVDAAVFLYSLIEGQKRREIFDCCLNLDCSAEISKSVHPPRDSYLVY